MPTVIITGASAGIGEATAARYRAADAPVFNLSRRPCPVAGVTHLSCDLAERAQIDAALEVLLPAVTGATSVALIHNASLMRKDTALDCTDADLEAVLAINVRAINHLNRALLPLLPPTSSVVYVGSTLAEKAVAGAYSYVLSKHAQLGMMRATCQDLMGRGVHTALVCPGFTDTEMLRTHLGNDAGTIEAIGAMNSFGRLVAADEIARLIEWVHDNPVLNGAVLHGNLGQKES